MKSPIPLYTGVLTSIGCFIDSQGYISQSIAGSEPVPIDIDSRRLVLPTPEVLQVLDNSRMIAFHPVCENITMGNSPVIEKFRRMVQLSIATRISTLAYDLLFAVVGDDTKQLSSPITTVAKQIPDANKKTLGLLEKVLQSMNGEDRTPIRIYLKRQAEVGGVKFRREAAVYFPLMEEFADNKPADMIYDVKMSQKQKATLRQLFNIILPNIEVPNQYSIGSNSTVAPNFDALLRVTYQLCREIGACAYHYRKYLNVADYRTDLTWGDEEINLSEYAQYIPTLDGNDGVIANATANQQSTMVNVPGMPTMATPGAIGATNMHAGIATVQNPGVVSPVAPPVQKPFRGLGTTPPATSSIGLGNQNAATRVAHAQPITNPSIYANPPQMGMPGMMPGQMMPQMGMPGMMPGMPMPGMMPGMGMMPQMGMMPGMGMPMPGMMPPMGMQPMMGMGMPGQGAPFPAVGQQPQQMPQQAQMMQQPMMQQQMMYPGMPGMPMMQQPMGYQTQPGGGLFKRA